MVFLESLNGAAWFAGSLYSVHTQKVIELPTEHVKEPLISAALDYLVVEIQVSLSLVIAQAIL